MRFFRISTRADGRKQHATRMLPTRATILRSNSWTTNAADVLFSAVGFACSADLTLAPLASVLFLACRRLPIRFDADEFGLFAIKPQRGQPAAPDAAGVDRVHAEAREAAECRPMPAHNADVAFVLARHFVPRIEPGTLRAGRTFLAERDASAHVAIAHAG